MRSCIIDEHIKGLYRQLCKEHKMTEFLGNEFIEKGDIDCLGLIDLTARCFGYNDDDLASLYNEVDKEIIGR